MPPRPNLKLKLPSLKKATSQQRVKLDQSDLLLLKELASFLLSIDFNGSQLEALLLTRASQASLLGCNTPSILTPFPVLDPSSASESEPGVEVETPLVPSQAGGTANPTSQPSTSVLPSALEAETEAVSDGIESPSESRVAWRDYSFANATVGGKKGKININNHCNTGNTGGASRINNSAFANSNISGSNNINNGSFNDNNGCFNTTTSTTNINK